MMAQVHDTPDEHRAQMDSGAFATCTNQQHLLHNYREFGPDYPCPIKLLPVADGIDLTPHGVGYLHVPALNSRGHLAVRCFYHPELRATVIDERDLLKANGRKLKDFRGHSFHAHPDSNTFTFHAEHRLRRSQDIHVHGILIHGKYFSGVLIPPDLPASHPKATPKTSSEAALQSDPEFTAACEEAVIQAVYSYQEHQYEELRESLKSTPRKYHGMPFHEYISQYTPVNSIKAETQRLLWHQRLGHPSDYYLYHAHKHIKGVPKFTHMHAVLDTCPTCVQAKQTKEPAGENSTKTATVPFQGLSIDFSFAGVRSKDSERAKDYLGVNGETCWILVSDHFTGYLVGDTRVNKGSPIKWLERLLDDYAPRISNKYVYMDQGGELFKNPEVRSLFTKRGYDVRPTGADSSHQNGPVERAHLTVANGLRSMLHGASLPVKFWPYAFHHYVRLKNALPVKEQEHSPVEMATGKQEDFSALRTFGCRVWVRPPGRRGAKLLPNSRKGIFLGFLPNTTKNIIWYDCESTRIKIAKHARFDEGMNDLPLMEYLRMCSI